MDSTLSRKRPVEILVGGDRRYVTWVFDDGFSTGSAECGVAPIIPAPESAATCRVHAPYGERIQEVAMLTVVTGAAGFLGSSLCRRLLADGASVIGIDCLTKAYDLRFKTANIDGLLDHPNFQLICSDLAEHPPIALIDGAEVVYHLAGEASLTRSWGPSFADYSRNNIEATRSLLEACTAVGVGRLVYASSSSVYGDAAVLPTPETCLPQPISPDGVATLAGEHLCHAYQQQQRLPVTSLRCFTVYGPAQRPDMAFHRLFLAAHGGVPFTVWGDGEATRDFTYVDDVVDAIVRAGSAGWDGVANIGGGHPVSLKEVIDRITELAGPFEVRYGETMAGDARNTSADTSVAQQVLGWSPRVSLDQGIREMAVWAENALQVHATLR